MNDAHESSEPRTNLDDYRRQIPCHDPATGEALGEVPAMDADAIRAIVERARQAQVAWGQTSFAQRRAVLEDLLQSIVDNQAEICRICARDSGKTMVDAVMGEIFPVCEKLRYTIAHGERAEVAAVPVIKVVDTTGAGDQFAAGFLSGYVKGEPLTRCLKRGAICASEVIAHYGPRPEADMLALMDERL